MNTIEAIKSAGVVGAGGAGFPTHVKLGGRAEEVIINGSECEPLLRVDQQLLGREQEVLVEALEAIALELRPKRIHLAVKAKHGRLVEMWEGVKKPPVRVSALADFYPAGDEQVLVREVTGRTVPPGGIPPDAGVVVINVETLYNIGQALQGQPVIDKFVTIGGAVAQPKTLRVPVGAPVEQLISLAGGVTVGRPVYLEGGPMMGRITGPGQYVRKNTKAILALPSELNFIARMQSGWATVRRRLSHCEICRACTDMCPRHSLGHPLEPHRIMRCFAFGGQPAGSAVFLRALLCAECGLCENYSCPTGIFPRRVMVHLKRELLSRGVRYPRGDTFADRIGMTGEAPRVPSSRLIARLGLGPYDRDAPLVRETVEVREVCISLQPPFGVKCSPLVKAGQRVRRGEPVGEVPAGALGSSVHASIDGVVRRVTAGEVWIDAS